MKLVGRTAIVTGGANGIGAAIARRFVDEGARTVIVDIDDEAGHALEAELNQLGTASYVHADVGERLDVHNLVAATVDLYGEIDVLVNNAGIAMPGDFLEISEDDFDSVMRVNLKGTFLCSQAVARTMVTRVNEGGPAGSIINFTSISAVVALPDQVPYAVSKGGVRQLNTVMAQALAPHGIRVNAIGPGATATSMFEEVMAEPELKRAVMARTPLGRVGEPAEIAGIAVFLAGEDAGFITGQTIYADGGLLGQAYPPAPLTK